MIELDHPGSPPPRPVHDHAGRRGSVSYGDYTVFSTFQPVFSVSHRRAIGYHALLGTRDELDRPVPSQVVFERASRMGDLLKLGRMTEALHLTNFCSLESHDEWLFLTLHPAALADSSYGEALFSTLNGLGLPPQRIVLEVPEQAGGEMRRFAAIIESLRRRGFLIALDGFGAAHSNIDRVWHLRPDIVTLERGIVRQATGQIYIERVLPGLVSMLHESGRLVLMGGLETEREAMIALECNVDFVQGSFFSRPSVDAVDSGQASKIIDGLTDRLRDDLSLRHEQELNRLAPYSNALQAAAASLLSGVDAALACAPLLELADTARCFMLDGSGRQIEDNIVPPRRLSQRANRFAPLRHSEGASWQRRAYFVRALENPGKVQRTRPYLSINEAHLCVTVSIAVETAGTYRVLCADIDWEARRAA